MSGVICPESNKVWSVDVKAVRGYSSLVVNNVKPSVDHIIVLVIYNDKFDVVEYMPEMFVVPSLEVEAITSYFKSEKRIMKNALTRYKSGWEYLQS